MVCVNYYLWKTFETPNSIVAILSGMKLKNKRGYHNFPYGLVDENIHLAGRIADMTDEIAQRDAVILNLQRRITECQITLSSALSSEEQPTET